MDLLLTQVANRGPRDVVLRNLAWRICRAWRRISRVVRLSQLLLAKRLGLQPALPAEPHYLPDPDLSEIVQAKVRVAFERMHQQPPGVFGALARLIGRAGGTPRRWRLR